MRTNKEQKFSNQKKNHKKKQNKSRKINAKKSWKNNTKKSWKNNARKSWKESRNKQINKKNKENNKIKMLPRPRTKIKIKRDDPLTPSQQQKMLNLLFLPFLSSAFLNHVLL